MFSAVITSAIANHGLFICLLSKILQEIADNPYSLFHVFDIDVLVLGVLQP